MKKIIYTLLILSIFVSCNNETNIIRLKIHCGSGKYKDDNSNEIKGKIYFYESALVANLPCSKEQIISKLLEYHKKKLAEVFANNQVVNLSTTFYNKNTTTSYFITNDDDPGGFSSEILTDYYKKYGIAEINSTRQKNTTTLRHEITFANSDKSEVIK